MNQQLSQCFVLRPRQFARLLVAGCLLAGTFSCISGCVSKSEFTFDEALDHYQHIATEIDVPDVLADGDPRVRNMPAPLTVHNQEPEAFWDLTLEETIQIALAESEVIRDVGGRVLNGPTNLVSTVYDTALAESDPMWGPEAALSAFDANFVWSMLFEHNEYQLNNILIGGGSTAVDRDLNTFAGEINKRSATGSQFSLRNVTLFDRNNALLNRFPQYYETSFEGEVRQPLGQGAGIRFNRIAGPNARPGQYNGVVLARIKTDTTLADFEIAVRDLLAEVERAYWELYFAYRNLESRKTGRDSALKTWRSVQRKLEEGDSNLEQEAQARAQYYLFQSAVVEALSGKIKSGPAVAAPSTGVYGAERHLRKLLGLPASDGRLIRPADEPLTVETAFDWQQSLQDALWRRAELRKQKWQIKRRELELIASRNFLLPKFDVLARYRFPGFGEQLFGNEGVPQGSAFADLFQGGRREWAVGMQYSAPIGNRIGNTAVRNAEWALVRERAVFREQEREVGQELSSAFAEVDAALELTKLNYNRRIAAQQQLKQVRRRNEEGLSPLEFVLIAERQTTQADSAYYRSLVDYNLAIANLNLSRGTLLSYYNVILSEGPWSEDAHDSAQKQARRFRQAKSQHRRNQPPPISAGAFPQHATDVGPITGDATNIESEHGESPPEEVPVKEPIE